MSNRFVLIFGIIAALILAFLFYSAGTETVSHPVDSPSINILPDPVQDADTSTFTANPAAQESEFVITPQARYVLSGMLVSKHRYFYGLVKKLAPFDYAVIWGAAPDWLHYVKFSQAKRFCFFNYKLTSPVDRDYLQKHMSNNHMIPATDNLRNALRKAKKGDLVEISGYLVNVKSNTKGRGGFAWKTSLRRDDTGDGACEIIYFTKLRINNLEYE